MKIEIFSQKPSDFNPKAHIAAAYVEVGGALLFLQRSAHKQEPLRWGVPAGKLEVGETPEEGMRRELFEETAISIDAHTKMSPIGALFIRKPEIDYIYHGFRVSCKNTPQILLSNEHIAYKWVLPHQAKNLPLMAGAEEALEFFTENYKQKRSGSSVM